MDNDDNNKISLTVTTASADTVADELKIREISYLEVKSKRFGGEDVVNFIVTLSKISLPVLAALILAEIRSKRHVEVKFKGLVLRGISESSVERILLKLLGKNIDK